MSGPPPTIDSLVDSYKPVTPASIIAVGVVLPTLASAAVIARFYTKVQRKSKIGIDDWLILFALILCIGMGAMMVAGSAVHALGQPTPLGEGPLGFMTVKNYAIVTTEKIKYAFNMMQTLTFGAIKLSVLFFYRRIFKITGRWFDIVSYTMMAIVVMWTFGFFFVEMFECRTNFWAFWSTLSDLLTYCVDDVLYQKILSISDVVTDVLILMIPLPIIWRLQLSPERKIGISCVFLLGFLAVAFGIVRVDVYMRILNNAFRSSQGILMLSTWFYWSMVEMGMAIVAACLPSLGSTLGIASGSQTISRAIQSLLTLRSHASNAITTFSFSERRTRKGSKQEAPAESDLASTDSRTQFTEKMAVRPKGNSIEIYAVRDVEAQVPVVPGTIKVDRDVGYETARG